MAVIIDIRNKFGPIIVIIIGLALGLFVLETALNSNSNLLHGNKDVVGIIDGDKIHYNEYIAEVEKETEAYKLNNPNQPINDNTTNQIREQAWNKMIYDKINNNLYDKLGITVPEAEMKDMFFGTDPNPEVKKTFTNPQTHIFDPALVKNYVNNLDKSQGEGDDPVMKRARWVNFEDYVYDDRLQTKMRTLFKYGLYVPKWMAEDIYNDKNTKFNFDYISVPFTTVPDSTVKVTDADLQAYINDNKEKYKQDESRKIEYVIFKVNPSPEDTLKARTNINNDYKVLATEPLDTNYIKLNADRALDKFYYSRDKIAEEPLKDTLLKANIGAVIGPIYKMGTFYTAKLMDKKLMPDSVKASIIALSKQGADSSKQKQKADSIMNAIQGGASFEELARKYSEDKNSAAKGGDIGFIKQGNLQKEMNDFLFFTGNQGDMKLINTANAYFIMKIVTAVKINYSVQYYVFSIKVEASQKTDKAIYEQASQFASHNSTDQAFSGAFKTDKNLNKQTAESARKSDYQLSGLDNAREIVSWAYKSDLGAVSPVIQTGNNYVIAHLAEIHPEGVPSVDALRKQVEPLVRNLKKGQKIAADISGALALNATFESLATKYGVDIKNIASTDFNESYIPNLGQEDALLGTVACMKEGQVSKPVIGNSSVFVVKLNSITKPTPIADYTGIKREQLNGSQSRVQYGMIEALKKQLKINDLRYNFF